MRERIASCCYESRRWSGLERYLLYIIKVSLNYRNNIQYNNNNRMEHLMVIISLSKQKCFQKKAGPETVEWWSAIMILYTHINNQLNYGVIDCNACSIYMNIISMSICIRAYNLPPLTKCTSLLQKLRTCFNLPFLNQFCSTYFTSG